jgi:hypothetical protein
MNGAGILGILAFLGAFQKIELCSFIWMLSGLGTLVSGLLLATYLSLRTMKIGAYFSQHTFEDVSKHQRMHAGLEHYDYATLNQHSNKIQPIIKLEAKKDIIQITFAYCLFSKSIGCTANALLYLRFTNCWLWLVGLGMWLLLTIILAYSVYRLCAVV